MKQYYPTIGIECHVQLKTLTKLFAGVNNDARNAEPNTLVSPICFGLPGTLPVLNDKAIHLAIRAGLALKAEIAHYSKFDRKHYFYPDLPKGYQITQFDQPIILKGNVEGVLPNGERFVVRVERAHLEEDAGKSTHPEGEDYSLVDLNRAGTPLLEIVSMPDMHTPIEAKAYARELYLLMRYADVSDADLYYGNMRFDVNVSVSTDPSLLGTRTETKNLNSFKSVEKAVEYEIKRQTELLERGEQVTQETRGWDDSKQKTFSQRTKEDAHDYRYFPEPDIPPIVIADEQIDNEKVSMSVLPNQIRSEMSGLGLDRSQVESLIDTPELAIFVHELIDNHDTKTVRTISNWLTGEIKRLLSGDKVSISEIIRAKQNLITLSSMLDEGLLSSTSAKDMLGEMIHSNLEPKGLASSKNLLQVSDESELVMIAGKIITENKKAVDDYRSGEHKSIGFLVGQVMKETAGKANPSVVRELLVKLLGQ